MSDGKPLAVVLADHLSWANDAGMRRCTCSPIGEWMSPMQYATHLANKIEENFAVLPAREPLLDLPTRIADLADAIDGGEGSRPVERYSETEWQNSAYNEGLIDAADRFRTLIRVDTIDAEGEPHSDVLRTTGGRVITEDQIETWGRETEPEADLDG